MALLSSIYQYGIYLGIVGFILCGSLLCYCIYGVVRTMRKARLFSVPLVDKQEIDFAEAGRIVLCMEGPLLSRRFAHLDYELTGPDGMAARSRIALLRAGSSSFTKARMGLRVYDIACPGRYVFQIRGLEGAKPSDSEHEMVFTRPHLLRSMIYLLGIVLAACLTIGSIVLFFLRLASV
jgi:hypothetical protein